MPREASCLNVAGDMSAREDFNEWKQVNDILILTNITTAAAGAAVDDPGSGRLASVGYRDTL